MYSCILYRFHVVDDDTAVPIPEQTDEFEEEFRPAEELPTIGSYTDARPSGIQELDKYRQSHQWKPVGGDEDDVYIDAKEAKEAAEISCASLFKIMINSHVLDNNANVNHRCITSTILIYWY